MQARFSGGRRLFGYGSDNASRPLARKRTAVMTVMYGFIGCTRCSFVFVIVGFIFVLTYVVRRIPLFTAR